jgi:hypothetical protein
MITKLICLYLDFQEVSSEVKDIVNVTHYGDLLYKKQKLKTYHQSLYANTSVSEFVYLKNSSQLFAIIDQLHHASDNFVILHHSSFAITQPNEFYLFIEKISYLDISLSISDFDEQKPFVILNAQNAIQALEKIHKNPESTDNLIETEIEVNERFKLERFYKTIRTSVDFIEFLHTNFEARFFNSIQKDELFITKSSENLKKIEYEYLYYEYLPDELKVFFLKPIQLHKTNDWYSYKLEKLNIPDVSILWLHSSFSQKEFSILLDKLFLFLAKRPERELVDSEQSNSTNQLYITKVADRIAELKSKPEYITIAEIIKNSTSLGNIDSLFDLYKEKLSAILKRKNYKPSLALSHGDFCASNMLYDKRINILKLIDPRGAETQDGLYFDSYYDVCKLSHSFMGDYDLINNGLFELTYTNNLQIQLATDKLPNNELFKKLFLKKLDENNFDSELVRIFEVSLFISMLPLHIDNPKKVLAFILNAVKLLNQIETK